MRRHAARGGCQTTAMAQGLFHGGDFNPLKSRDNMKNKGKYAYLGKKALPTCPRKPYNPWHDDGLRAAGGVHSLVRPLTATHPTDPAGFDEAAEIAPMTPLALMLALMREKWVEGDRDGAVKLACAAAPYLHARRSAAAHNPTMPAEAHRLNDAELCRRLAGADGGMESSAEDT